MQRCRLIFIFIIIFLSLLLHAVTGQYPPMIKNDLNTSEYDWNAINSKWVNMRALAMMALDGTSFHQDATNLEQVGDLSDYSRGDIRGIRLGVGGTINFDRAWTYLASGSVNSFAHDFNSTKDDRFTLFDFVLGIPVWGEYTRVQIGKMKEPISMERTMGMVFEQVMERPMHLDALLSSRNTGISISNLVADKRITWKAGFYSRYFERGTNSWSKSNRQAVVRVTTVAYEDKEAQRLLHLGTAYRYEDIREKTVRYDVGPEQYFVDPWLDTGEFTADSSNTVNLELTYLDGPLWLASEYTATAVDAPQSRNPIFKGFHVAANYFFTGEHREYNYRRAVVRRITPILDFSKEGWGAVELSARYSYMDLSDRAIKGGEMDITSLGLIWHPRRDIQFHVQWSRANLDKASSQTGRYPLNGHADIMQFRLLLVVD